MDNKSENTHNYSKHRTDYGGIFEASEMCQKDSSPQQERGGTYTRKAGLFPTAARNNNPPKNPHFCDSGLVLHFVSGYTSLMIEGQAY